MTHPVLDQLTADERRFIGSGLEQLLGIGTEHLREIIRRHYARPTGRDRRAALRLLHQLSPAVAPPAPMTAGTISVSWAERRVLIDALLAHDGSAADRRIAQRLAARLVALGPAPSASPPQQQQQPAA